jgi:hypothetical protein
MQPFRADTIPKRAIDPACLATSLHVWSKMVDYELGPTNVDIPAPHLDSTPAILPSLLANLAAVCPSPVLSTIIRPERYSVLCQFMRYILDHGNRTARDTPRIPGGADLLFRLPLRMVP